MLKGINGPTDVMDDVLTAVPMKKEHGIWIKVAERATSYHLKPTFQQVSHPPICRSPDYS